MIKKEIEGGDVITTMPCPNCSLSCSSKNGWMTTKGYFPFEDEHGVWHHHDGNEITDGFRCACGAAWTLVSREPCRAPGCDWHSLFRMKRTQ